MKLISNFFNCTNEAVIKKKMKIIMLSFFVGFFSNATLVAQTIPDVASLNKFIEVPVNKSTGIPNIEIPIYTLKERNFSLPISLSYHAGGIRVEETASNFGLGFAMNAEAIISRTVRGLPDDFPTGFYVNGGKAYPYIYPVITPPLSGGDMGTISNQNNGTLDTEPDLFFFNVNGYSGKFIFGKNNKITLIPEQDIKIEVIPNTLFSWKITTPDGNQYYISDHTDQTRGENVNLNYVSAWHLDHIKTKEGDIINFEYHQTGGTQRVLNHPSQVIRVNECVSEPLTTSLQTDIGNSISKITSKSCIIEFNYKSSLREDYNSTSYARAIDNIKIIDNINQTTKLKFVFKTSYFLSTFPSNNLAAEEYLQKRLRLDEITQESTTGSDLPPYKFYYNKHNPTPANTLPSRLSAAQDDWGYYNGYENNFTLYPHFNLPGQVAVSCRLPLAFRNPNTDYKSAFILDEIVYPTAAVTMFNFEDIPTLDVDGKNTTTSGLRVKQIKTQTGSNLQVKTFEYENPFIVGGIPQYLQQIPIDGQPFELINICPLLGTASYYNMYMLSSSPVNNAGGMMSNYVIHGKVTEFDSNQGSVESYFNVGEISDEVAAMDIGVYPFFFTNPIINGDKLLREVEKDINGKMKKETSYIYAKTLSTILGYPDCYKLINPLCAEEPYYYTLNTGFGYLQQKEETLPGKNYDVDNNDVLTTMTQYEYGGLGNTSEAVHHQVTKQTTNASDGNLVITRVKYPMDYYGDLSTAQSSDAFDSPSNAITSLISKYIITDPVEIIKSLSVSGVERIIDGRISTYENVGLVTEMSKILKLNLNGNLSYSSGFNSTIQKNNNVYSFIHDDRYRERENFKYSPNANMIESSLSGGPIKSVLWGYSDEYPVAQVSNASSDEIYYEGFEMNGTSGLAHTGNKYFNNTNSFTTNDKIYPGLHGKQYVLSWWFYDGVKWNYSESPYVGQSITNSIIDDVRIFPVDAQMISYTYEPLTGLSSISNAASLPMFYQYDDFQRLQNIVNSDKNIVKNFSYNINATVLYYNEYQKSSFNKSDCSSGYSGTQVTYSVPAGKYSSLISPEDANNKAIAEISASGQNYTNSKGGCLLNYYSSVYAHAFTRNNCNAGNGGSTVTFSADQGLFISTISQADADQQAVIYVNGQGQLFANDNGTCPVVTLYAKLVRDNIYTFDDGFGNSTETADYNIHLYKDAACTQPAQLETSTNFYCDYSTLNQDRLGVLTPFYSSLVIQGSNNDSIVFLGNYDTVDTQSDGSFRTTTIKLLSGNPNIIVIN